MKMNSAFKFHWMLFAALLVASFVYSSGSALARGGFGGGFGGGGFRGGGFGGGGL